MRLDRIYSQEQPSIPETILQVVTCDEICPPEKIRVVIFRHFFINEKLDEQAIHLYSPQAYVPRH